MRICTALDTTQQTLTIFDVFFTEEAAGVTVWLVLTIWPGLWVWDQNRAESSHVSSLHWSGLHRCMRFDHHITRSPSPWLTSQPRQRLGPKLAIIWQVLVVCLYLLFSPAGLFEDKFGDVGGPGIGHVCGQVGSLGLWNTELSLTQQSTLSAGRPEERRGAHCQLGPLNCSQYSAAA